MDAFLPPRRRRERNFRNRPHLLEELSEEEIVQKYRLTEGTIYTLLQLIERDVQPIYNVGCWSLCNSWPKANFIARGGLVHGISKSSVCTSIWQVIGAINQRLMNIQFPTTPDKIAGVKRDFHGISGIPNCIGAIDCTHIPILAPQQNEASYVCRKGYHSINVQATVNAHMRFTDVVCQWPGGTHDSVIFNNCGLKEWLQAANQGWLLGDSGYPLRSYLMTPKINPQTRAEIAYNNAHCRTRIVVERAFGLLKSRFRCLHKTGGYLQVRPDRAAKVFLACAKLHNLCLDDGHLPENIIQVQGNQDNEEPVREQPDRGALQIREALIRQF